MITRERKERLCEEHRQLLELIFSFGKGIMYRNHVQRFMSLFESVNEIDTSKHIKELIENKLLDKRNLFGAVVLRLKKFPVYYLLQCNRESVSSITFSANKVKKSAFLCEIVLQRADFFKKKGMSLENLRSYYLNSTTYFLKDKDTFNYLERQIAAGWCNKDFAKTEVAHLRLLKERAQAGLKTKEPLHLEDLPFAGEFNLNAMMSANIFLGMRTRQEGCYVDILDSSGLMTSKKFARKVNATFDYLNVLFNREKIDFKFVLHVQSKERKKFIEEEKELISQMIFAHSNIKLSFDINNLNLESRLFRNQKVLLNS